MITDEELLRVYGEGDVHHTFAMRLRAVAAYAARRQREVDCQHVLSAIKGYDGTQEYIDAQRAAPLVTDADNG